MENQNALHLPVKVKLALGIGEFSKNTLNILNTFFLLWFYTDVAKIPAAAASVIMLIAKVWDAINDPMMGIIVDNTKSKEGRCRFWLKYLSVPAGVCVALSYTVPSLSETGTIIWVAITYIFQGMAQTATNIPLNTMLARITDDRLERVKLGQWRGFGALIASALIPSVALPFATLVGGGNPTDGFLAVAIVCGVIYALGFLIVAIATKGYERTYEEELALGIVHETQKLQIGKALMAIVKNKVCLVVCCANFGYLIFCSLMGSALVYYMQYNLNNANLMSVYSMLSSIIGFVAVAMMGMLGKKFGNAKSCAIGSFILVICYILRFVTHDTITWILYLAWALEGIGTGLFAQMIYQCLVDSITYGKWKTGVDNQALIMSVFTFFQKVALALGSVVTAALLGVVGYQEGAVVQSDSVLDLFFWEMVVIPLIMFTLLTFIFGYINKYEKQIPQMEQELKEREAAEKVAANS